MPRVSFGFRCVLVLIASLLLRVAPAMPLPTTAMIAPQVTPVAAAEAPCHEHEASPVTAVTAAVDHAAHTAASDATHHGACQIACDLGAAPALSTPMLTLGSAPAPIWVARITALHGVTALPPEPPPPNLG